MTTTEKMVYLALALGLAYAMLGRYWGKKDTFYPVAFNSGLLQFGELGEDETYAAVPYPLPEAAPDAMRFPVDTTKDQYAGPKITPIQMIDQDGVVPFDSA
jgi:hypothetical protein